MEFSSETLIRTSQNHRVPRNSIYVGNAARNIRASRRLIITWDMPDKPTDDVS